MMDKAEATKIIVDFRKNDYGCWGYVSCLMYADIPNVVVDGQYPPKVLIAIAWWAENCPFDEFPQ